MYTAIDGKAWKKEIVHFIPVSGLSNSWICSQRFQLSTSRWLWLYGAELIRPLVDGWRTFFAYSSLRGTATALEVCFPLASGCVCDVRGRESDNDKIIFCCCYYFLFYSKYQYGNCSPLLLRKGWSLNMDGIYQLLIHTTEHIHLNIYVWLFTIATALNKYKYTLQLYIHTYSYVALISKYVNAECAL